MGERRGADRTLMGRLEENHLENPGRDGRIIGKQIFKK
jgi:hypothetical protein